MTSDTRRPNRRSRGTLAAALALTLAFPVAAARFVGPAQAAPGGIPTMPVDDVRPGMKGHAVTVFSGTGTDRFDIEVIDVIRDYQTGQDAILFKSPDPRLVHSGIVGGMSGSPIFIDGKLVGALAYGYRFNKDPIGGITPIDSMLEIDKLPHRPEVQPIPRASGREGTAAWADQLLGLSGTSPLPARQRPGEAGPYGGLERLTVPTTVSGFGPRASAFLSSQLGLYPVRGGGGGGGSRAKAGAKKKWAPGDSVSVVLIGGDNSAAPNGTVTWVGGNGGSHLLGFGHPMYEMGPSNLPIADARVHVIIPSVERSVKIASPLEIQGTMIQDRQPAISLRTDVDAPVIPVTTEIVAPDSDLAPRTYNSIVAENPVLSPNLSLSLLIQGLNEAAPDAVEVVAKIEHEIALETSKGPRTFKVEEETWFPRGVAPTPILRSRGSLLLQAAFDNDYEVAKIRSITQRATVQYGTPVETVEEVRFPTHDVHAGELLNLKVRLKTPRGGERWTDLAVRIPDDAGDQTLQLQIAGGDFVRPYAPIPRDLDGLLDNVAASFGSRTLVASLFMPQEGLATEHGLIPDLPDSVLESLSPSGGSAKAVRFKRTARRVVETKTLIYGSKTLKFDVLPRRSSAR